MAAIDALGYGLSKDMFDFEAVPSSVMDKAYRWEISTDEIRELTGRRVEKDKTLDLWFAYKLTAGGDRKAGVLAMLGLIETVEDTLLGALSSLPSLVMKAAMSKLVGGYIVFNVSLRFTYWRDI
jgi:hypothetical protein